ncbi:pyridoxal phosphate-dependent decarboxylase family protein [Halorussus halophilus]|uniref:pyridoxal phosphate-dependent decarboxylase family protein n=1 Tax=Halorussus halophilus TaxID=2650975 RepID=UPI001301426B|nr:aminotransferase class I/II-fold pyridoxal phosphate-dependent enzyme [Halorussus halophilus]
MTDDDRPMTDGNRPLELSREEMAAMMEAATERVIDHVETLPDQPAADLDGAEERAEQLREPLPTEPTNFDDLLDLLFDGAIPKSLNNPHPGFMAYIPGGGLFHSAVADATNRYVGTWFAAPALTRIEANVVEWFCEMVGYPDDAFGLLTTGGSMANLIATTTARRERLPQNFLDGIIYTSDQSHHSVAKAAVLAGFPPENVRSISTDDEFRIRVDELERAIEEDSEADGREPFMVVATAGSTNTGAVDDLDAVADSCQREDLWLHADAAYGGFFAMTDEGSDRLAGLDRADSITVDPHKGLFLPYGTGALLVRDGQALARAHAVEADYIPDWDPDSGLPDFSQLGPELSRDFRGLRVWLPLKMHGVEPFRTELREKLELAEWANERLRELDHVRVVAEPQLSTLAFRADLPDVAGEELDELNQELLAAINRRNRVHLSGTTLNDRFALRISILSFRTHREHVEQCLEDVAAAKEELLD